MIKMEECSHSLLSDNSDERTYERPGRHRKAYHILAIASCVNLIVFLGTFALWLSSWTRVEPDQRFEGAGDMKSALHANAIQYEVRSYSSPLVFDEVTRKVVVKHNDDLIYTGPPSLENDALWDDLVRGEYCTLR
jgi:hypothetical protein